MISPPRIFDCLIVGGGPAGLTAALYLSRFRRDVILVDAGQGRCRLIPTSHNYPGFTGISGKDFLESLHAQASRHGAKLCHGVVQQLKRSNEGFVAELDDGSIISRTVLLASGMVDAEPGLPNFKHLVYSGVVRFCPICDGYEAAGKRVALFGPIQHIVPKALFLRTYTQHIILLPTDNISAIEDNMRQDISAAGLELPAAIVKDLHVTTEGGSAVMADNKRLDFDILYPAMGAKVQSTLAVELGAESNDESSLKTDQHQMTNVSGLYAAGDLTGILAQISVATGQAAIAATGIHNRLARNWC